MSGKRRLSEISEKSAIQSSCFEVPKTSVLGPESLSYIPLVGLGKTVLALRALIACVLGTKEEHLCRMLKKAVQQGRRRIETGGVPSGVR
jgi:hypothetical protein